LPRVLIIDDDKALTRALSVRLKNVGFDVAFANSATEASHLTLQYRPDAIVLDVDMPHYTGPEFHDCLRFAGRARHIPVIYLSGQNSESNRRMAFAQGAKAFVAKPYDIHHLVQTLHNAIGAATQRDTSCAGQESSSV